MDFRGSAYRQRHYVYTVLACALLLLATAIRVWSFPVVTSDYTYFVAKWFLALKENPGLTAFLHPFADYTPAYLYVIKILTWVPLPSLYSVKIFTLLCDLAIAYTVYVLLRATTRYTHEQRLLASSITFIAPTLLINSSLWGQSDAVYALPVLLSLYALLCNRPLWATVWFGVAMSIKLQAIFFLPVIVGYLWHTKRLHELIVVPLIYLALAIPALIGGATVGEVMGVYLHQSGEYTSLNVSSQSLFAFTDTLTLAAQTQTLLFWLGITVALIVAIGGMWLAARTQTPYAYVELTLAVVLLIPLFLPRMHERYFYLADLFSLLYAYYDPRHWFVPVLVLSASFLAYMPFLSAQVGLFSPITIDLRIPASMLVGVSGYVLWRVASQWRLHAVP